MRKNALSGRGPAYLAVCLVLLALLVLSVLAAVSFGTMTIPIGDVYRVILHELFGLGDPAVWGSGGVHDVVWLIRLPRLILAIGVGMGLSVCGVVMQAIVKNPLADPYVLGVSSGAYLGATLAMLLGLGTTASDTRKAPAQPSTPMALPPRRVPRPSSMARVAPR